MLRDVPKFWIAILGIFGYTLTFGPLILGYQARCDAYYEQRRQAGMHEIMANAKPVIAAIRAYEKQHGKPPLELDDLSPSFPWPGALARYGWEYSAYNKGWSLTVTLSTDDIGIGIFRRNRFVYYSDGQYPHDGDMGRLERVGEWGYYGH
jgi:hypothetical protein